MAPRQRAPAVSDAGYGRRVLWDPAVLLITVTGLFHFVRGAAVDGLIFMSVVTVLAFGELRPPRATSRPGYAPRTAAGRLLAAFGIVAVVTGYGWLVGGFPRTGWPAWTAVAVPGVVAVGLAWREREDRYGRRPPVNWWTWATVGSLCGIWQLAAYLLQQQPSPTRLYDYPTLSLFLYPLLDSQAGRSVGLAVWLAAGGALLWRFLGTAGGRDE